jgi:hypothetical protein
MVVTKLKLEFPKQTIVGQQINSERMKGIIKTGNGDGHDCGNVIPPAFFLPWEACDSLGDLDGLVKESSITVRKCKSECERESEE